jgi:hypothetical protein
MLKMIKGARVTADTELSEEYEIFDNMISANVDAERISEVIEKFLEKNCNESLFLFIEVPASLDDETIAETFEDGGVSIETPHNDVYYLDGISAGAVRELLDIFSEILINDGLSAFGVGNPQGDEVGKYKYNVMKLYCNDTHKYADIFESLGIRQTDRLVTAWETFSLDTPGISEKYTDSEGRDVYDIIEILSESGLYKAEQRESE